MQNTFTIKEALSFGWQKTKENWMMFLLISAVYNLVLYIPETYNRMFKIIDWETLEKSGELILGSTPMIISYVLLVLVFMIISPILNYNVIKSYLQMSDGLSVRLKDLFKFEKGQGKKVIRFYFGFLAYSIVMILGFMALIIPGIYFMFTYMFVPYLLVDKDVSIKEAFRLSKEATNGNKKQLALMVLASFGVVFLGVVALLVGIIPAMIILSFAGTYIYRKLTNKTV